MKITNLQQAIEWADKNTSPETVGRLKSRAAAKLLAQAAKRYEKIRKMNARQFAELYQRNLAGEVFDDLVDKS